MVASLHQQRALRARARQDLRTAARSFEMKKKTEAGVEQPRPDPRSHPVWRAPADGWRLCLLLKLLQLRTDRLGPSIPLSGGLHLVFAAGVAAADTVPTLTA